MQPASGFLLLSLLAVIAAPAGAQPDIFADPQNLKVLPEDISPQELRNTMRGIAIGLGARCETCHVGEPGQDLSEFDFASDEKDTKLVARRMLEMVSTINRDYVGKLEGERTAVDCVRCHRGVLKPLLTGEVLRQSLADGFEPMRAKYLELRGRYYGTHSYDFSEGILAELGQGVARDGQLDTAQKILKLNLEYFPDGFQTHFMLGELYARQGDKPAARDHYQRALAINPHPMLQQRLQELED